MDEKQLLVRKLRIEYSTGIGGYEAEFGQTAILNEDNAVSVLTALAAITGNRVLAATVPHVFPGTKVRLWVEVSFGEESCTVGTTDGKSVHVHPPIVRIGDGMGNGSRLCRALARQSFEEMRAVCFLESEDYSDWLFRYAHAADCYAANAFRAVTNGIGNTATFRRCIREYAEGFEPQKLFSDGDVCLILSAEGRFVARSYPDSNHAVPNLNEEGRFLMNFGCFLALTGFWQEFGSIRDIHHLNLPIYVCSTKGIAEKRKTFDFMAERTAALGRQIFIADL